MDFDDPLSTDYNAVTVSANLGSATRILDLFVSGGWTDIERDGIRENIDGFVGGLNGVYTFSESLSASFTISQDFRDNFDPGRSIQNVGGLRDVPIEEISKDDENLTLQQRTDTSAVFRVRRMSLGVDYHFGPL